MRLVAKTDIGNQRAENQDSYRAGRLPDDTAWAVVCDGMGGARGGRLASNLATDKMQSVFLKGIADVHNEETAYDLLCEAVEEANDAVYTKAMENPSTRGMGTTAVCAVIRGGMAYYAHVGDSRAYLYHGHTLSQLTRDHSMVQELVEQGAITEQEAATHPRKNLITRALGVGAEVLPDCNSIPVRQGDILLLCSDGLSNFVTIDQMESILEKDDFFTAADRMVDAALEAGGLDNITVLLVEVEAAEK